MDEPVRQYVEFAIITWSSNVESASRLVPGHVREFASGRWTFELDGFPPIHGDAESGERQIAALILRAANRPAAAAEHGLLPPPQRTE